MRAVVLDLEARGPVSADHGRDDGALLEHLERAEHRGAPDPVRAQREIDLILAQVMVGLQEMIEDEAALPGQAEAVFREMLGEHKHDLIRVLILVAGVVDDKFSHDDRVSVWACGRNILVITPCYNHGMKRLWPLPVLLLLALPLLAQEDDEAPAGDAPTQDAAPQEDKPAPAENEGVANGETPDADKQPAAEPNSSDNQPAPEGAEGESTGEKSAEKSTEKPAKEESLISVKVSPPPVEEGDEEDITPPVAKTKVVATATLIKAPKKGKPSKSAKGVKVAKGAKGKTSVPAVVKTKAPVIAAEPPPPLIPAVPLTPITPRNP